MTAPPHTPSDDGGVQRPASAATRPRLPAGRLPHAWAQAWQRHSEPLRQRWLAMGPRERQGVSWVLAAVALLLVVLLGVRPAWRTLQEAPAQLNQVESQLQQMNQLANEARSLRATPAVSMAQSTEALKAASDRLGAVARLNLQGQQATLTLNGITPEALAEWLREVRTVGRVRVSEAKLARTGTTYSGSVLITLGGGSP